MRVQLSMTSSRSTVISLLRSDPLRMPPDVRLRLGAPDGAARCASDAVGAHALLPLSRLGFRLRLWARARAQCAVYQQRPWLTRLPVTGPPSGPHQIVWMETALAVLARTPLDWAHKIGALSLIGGYVVQAVRQDHELARSRAEDQGRAHAERAWSRALADLVARTLPGDGPPVRLDTVRSTTGEQARGRGLRRRFLDRPRTGPRRHRGPDRTTRPRPGPRPRPRPLTASPGRPGHVVRGTS
ncbi:TetR/AcrR family transcriptional regulator C-terminal domain-containing protein [Streptomyces sp. NPDC059851]|uniref:TetR/AcrR family transcriptional regulator C-terminal domain-containing protein n=1 Tax=Streptomyces sp. NPDC059851 TaxID=3346971 RepID=UPI003654F286